MKVLRFFACIALLTSISVAQGSAKATHDPNLAPVEWLTNGTWTANVKSPDGKFATLIEARLGWAATGTSISFNTEFNKRPQYFGFYTYDQARKQIRFFYASAQGDLTEGSVTVRENGFEQDFSVSTREGTVRYRATLIRDGQDAYDLNVYPDGSNKAVVTAHYERK
jgi:hypothetical protein